MKHILGLILEANPFHNGHKYFIEKAKEETNASVVVAVVSTNFSMRGDIQVIDKFTKTKLMLENGIDVILELPYLGALASADYFAYNAIKTLLDFSVTDIAFGAESDLDTLKSLESLSNKNEFNTYVKSYLDKGFSYSTATVKALKEMTDDLNLINSYSLPNNTLGIQYLKAIKELNSNVNITVIKRIGNNYYDEETSSNHINLSSATSLRNNLRENKEISLFVPDSPFNKYIDLKKAENNLYNLFQYQLITSSPNKLKEYLGVNEGIENRLLSFIDKPNLEEFIQNVETKRYNKTYIKRIILHILLKVKKDYSPQRYNHLRILGMNSIGKKYISHFNKEIKNKIITTIKNKDDEIVNYELLSTKIYGIITNQTDLYLEEYKIPIIGE